LADRRRIRQKLREVIRTGKGTQYSFPGPGPQGLPAWYRQNAGPIIEGGKVTGLLLITHDITEDKQRLDSLLEGKRQAEAARAYDRALLSSIGEGLIVVNEQGEIANINPSAAAMLGCEPKEVIGAWFPKAVPAFTSDGQPIDQLERPVIKALTSGQSITQIVYYRNRDGSMFPAAVTAAPVVINGKPVGVIEVFRDLTHERQLEQAKEEFVSLASHQLRTPATGVKAYISMLLDGYVGEVPPEQRAFLEKVFESNERQLRIVNDILNVARADAGHIVPETATTDITALIQEIVEEQLPVAAAREQVVQVVAPEILPTLMLDADLVRMAVENLVSNALKYTPEGGTITLELTATPHNVVISITDTGVGIAEADIPKLFRRFSRVKNPLSASGGGSGLGLYLTETIVRLHHGRIQVESQPGIGTTFSVELPLTTKPLPLPATERRKIV